VVVAQGQLRLMLLARTASTVFSQRSQQRAVVAVETETTMVVPVVRVVVAVILPPSQRQAALAHLAKATTVAMQALT
jgi:hypothetical protein